MTRQPHKQSAYARRKRNKEIRLWQKFQRLPHALLKEYLLDPDPMKRIAAARELCGCDSKAAFGRCLKLARDTDPVIREYVVLFLGACAFPDTEAGEKTEARALALLQELAAGDPRARIREQAARALEKRAEEDAKPKKDWGPPPSAYQRRKDARQSRLWAEFASEPHARLVAYLRDPDPMKRSVAVMELHCRNSKSALRDALKLCRSEDPVLRENAALVLGQLNFPDTDDGMRTAGQVTALLYELAVRDPYARVRAGALYALGHRSSHGGDHTLVLDAARAGAKDASCSVRHGAAFALMGINLPGAEEVLLPLLRDPDPDVRDWAPLAVQVREGEDCNVYDTPEIREALLELAGDDDWEIRYEAFRALGTLRERRAGPLLAREMDNDEAVYFDLARAAGRIGDPALIPILEKALERFGDDDDTIANALEALRKGA